MMQTRGHRHAFRRRGRRRHVHRFVFDETHQDGPQQLVFTQHLVKRCTLLVP